MEEEEEEIKNEEFEAKNEMKINNQASSQVSAKDKPKRNKIFKFSSSSISK